MPVDAELAAAIRESERDLAKPERLARFGSVKNNVGHFAAAQRLGRLLAKHPAHGIEHVRFPAAVRPDDGRDAFVEFENSFIREGFEADEFERLKMHVKAGHARS